MKSSFKEIRIGNPLLYTPEDYEAVIVAITKNGAKEGATLLVGHGTYTPATAQYAMLDYMLKEKGFKDYSVGTIEGYPTFDTMVAQVKANGTKKVLLCHLCLSPETMRKTISPVIGKRNWKRKATR